MLEVVNEYADVRKAAHGKNGFGFVKTPVKKTIGVREQQRDSQGNEELARIREMSDSHLSNNRLPNQEDLKDQVRQMGKPMHSSQLILKVRKMNPGLICEDSINCRGSAGFYFADSEGNKKPTNAHFKKGILPEFSVIETDAADLPVRVHYGWREVLLRLVRARQLSLAQVLRVFGDATTVQSSNWRRSVQQYRN